MLCCMETTQTTFTVPQEVTCLPYHPQKCIWIAFRSIVTWCHIFNLGTVIIQKCGADSRLIDTILNNSLSLVSVWHVNSECMDACLWVAGSNQGFQVAGGKQVLKCFS